MRSLCHSIAVFALGLLLSAAPTYAAPILVAEVEETNSERSELFASVRAEFLRKDNGEFHTGYDTPEYRPEPGQVHWNAYPVRIHVLHCVWRE